ncbi:MAG: GNAT family N-acetyltransferase [Deltaproteobacteria bacterium]|nr:MAG: GNAT family N-acetyltransferase [Deltaproteobacteria bacterium]
MDAGIVRVLVVHEEVRQGLRGEDLLVRAAERRDCVARGEIAGERAVVRLQRGHVGRARGEPAERIDDIGRPVLEEEHRAGGGQRSLHGGLIGDLRRIVELGGIQDRERAVLLEHDEIVVRRSGQERLRDVRVPCVLERVPHIDRFVVGERLSAAGSEPGEHLRHILAGGARLGRDQAVADEEDAGARRHVPGRTLHLERRSPCARAEHGEQGRSCCSGEKLHRASRSQAEVRTARPDDEIPTKRKAGWTHGPPCARRAHTTRAGSAKTGCANGAERQTRRGRHRARRRDRTACLARVHRRGRTVRIAAAQRALVRPQHRRSRRADGGRGRALLYLVALKPGLQPIGMCGLLKRDKIRDVDLGYAFLPEFWSNGYARESAASVLAIARRLRLTAVAAFVSPGNAPSIRLLDKLGFAPAGETKLEPAAAPVFVYRLQLRSPPGKPHGRAQGG